jgi:branched-chain amino acid aminotransferase
MLASMDGTILDKGEATIPVTDEGLVRGDGVFEVVRLYAGRPFALEEHLERMRRSAANLRLEIDFGVLRSEIAALLDAHGDADAALRVMCTRGGRRIALIEEVHQFPPTIALSVVTYSPVRVLDAVKSLSYAGNMLATRLAKERGADDALLVTPHGRVLEAPTSSFFYVRDGGLITPPLDEHILDSITRRKVLELFDVDERSTTLDDVAAADEAFLASTFKEALPVHAIDDIVSFDAPGPVTREVAEAVSARIAEELAAATT